MKTGALSLAGLFIGFIVVIFGAYQQVSGQDVSVLISQVQVGGTVSGTASQEFIDVTNTGASVIDVTDWCLYYASSATSGQGTKLVCITTPALEQRVYIDAGSTIRLVTEEYLSTQTNAIPSGIFKGGLSATGGHVHLISQENMIVDTVGWGSAQFAETAAVTAPAGGMTMQRLLTAGQLIDTNNNAADFRLAPPPAVDLALLVEVTDFCLNQTEFPGAQAAIPNGFIRDDGGNCVEMVEQVSCEGVRLSEIQPNPSGADEGVEYVELYNTLATRVDVQSCTLQVNGVNHKVSGTIDAGTYLVVKDVALPNASGATIVLISDIEEVITYPANMRDDEAFALVTDSWEVTNRPTPGDANLSLLVESTSATSNNLAACPVGKVRNPETNRCRSLTSSESSLVPCAPNQYRSPETNRCRSSIAAASTLKSCEPNQIRNPETNRCKSVADASNVLKPCDEGEERNPETNRCRKITGVVGAASTIDPATSQDAQRNHRVLAIAVVLAVCYGIYEYRQDIGQKLRSVYSRVARRR